LQTIKFSTPAAELKAAMDLSAKFILLSDIHRKMVYVLRLDEVTRLLHHILKVENGNL
jgi:WD40 region of Ge1, enhancer of mRNA-decapping protein